MRIVFWNISSKIEGRKHIYGRGQTQKSKGKYSSIITCKLNSYNFFFMFYFKPYWGKTRITMNLRKTGQSVAKYRRSYPKKYREINRKLLRDFNFKQSEEQLCLTNYMVLNQNSSPSNYRWGWNLFKTIWESFYLCNWCKKLDTPNQ